MPEIYITAATLKQFEKYLYEEEKSEITIKKYGRDAHRFYEYTKGENINKELILGYKKKLITDGYAPRSVNSMLASVNKLLKYLGFAQCCVKSIKLQQQIYCPEKKELTKNEYLRLLEASKNRPRLQLVIETICSTGIRVSELNYFTVEAVKKGEVTVACKGKIRTILIPGKLKKKLLYYAAHNCIQKGIIFRTKTGKPLNRTNVWAEMKRICHKAHVREEKVFPHNLRKLFARIFYKIKKTLRNWQIY